MKKKLSFMLSLLAAAAMAVTLEETDKAFIVKNDNYTANFMKAQGGRLTLKITGADCNVQNISGSPVIYTSGERETYQKSYAANDAPISLRAQKYNAEIITNKSDEVVLKLTYKLWFGEAVQTITLDNSPVIRYHLNVNYSGTRLSKVEYALTMVLSDPDGIFYPDAKRVVGISGRNGSSVDGPSWEYAWHQKSKLGAGIIAPENQSLAGIEYMMQNRQEGGTSNYTAMTALYSPLQKYGRKNSLDFRWQVIAGSTPQKAQALADSVFGKDKTAKIHSCETQKLTIRPGQDNKILAKIRNRTNADAELKAKVFAVYGLDSEVQVAEAALTVKAGTIQALELPVKFPSDVKLGVALRTELYDAGGNLLDKATDFCSITDFVPRDSVFGFINVAHCNLEGSQDAWNRLQKRNYVGAYEYYHWAPSTIFGLVPEEESWKPGVAIYDVVIYKKFIKKLVENAHSHGVGVYAWITGLWNYNVGLRHLDMLQYCENGQPNIYDGIIRKDGSRVIALKPNIYTVERSSAWGKEMADSIDMFGWDGCRWDFSFLPSVANDPLFIGEKVSDWYDNKGVPASKLYPDPDKTGTECLKAWREAVAKRHPEFIYGANLGYREENRRSFPNYLKEAARNGLLIFEDMLEYYMEKWNTFEKWGKELALRADLVRPQGGTAVVGIMRGLPRNSVSYHLAQYTAASAGVKWWAYGGLWLDERSPERNRYFMRFAEYYFGTEFLAPENCPVFIAKKQNVLFEPFVRQRKTAEGREIVIPVVNMPDNNDYICAYHDEPPVRKNLEFKVDLQKGEKAEAWVMTPQNPEKALRIPVSNGIVTLPELKDTCMILVKCRGGK